MRTLGRNKKYLKLSSAKSQVHKLLPIKTIYKQPQASLIQVKEISNSKKLILKKPAPHGDVSAAKESLHDDLFRKSKHLENALEIPLKNHNALAVDLFRSPKPLDKPFKSKIVIYILPKSIDMFISYNKFK